MRTLCEASSPAASATPSKVPAAGIPTQIAELEQQVAAVRGLAWRNPVGVEPVTEAEMSRRVGENFDETYPTDLYARRSAAWRTIGVLPPDADLRSALRAYMTGQVVGYYDPATGELVYLGGGDDVLGVTERLVLAHELTHAIDDQHFDLSRIDDLVSACRDDAFAAALGAVEGSAQYFSTQVLFEFPQLDLGDIGDLAGALADALKSQAELASVPPFVQAIQQWPYTAGQTFMTSLATTEGDAVVNEALRTLPRTTEEVLHPELYPESGPAKVDVPDLTPTLGPDWGDLDAMQVGEAWLNEMLALRLDSTTANDAAAGWNGGVYRAFSDGRDVVVAMDTAWDATSDAEVFAAALLEWGGRDVVVRQEASNVTAVFGSLDTRSLEAAADLAVG
jgi:hypothetical protein